MTIESNYEPRAESTATGIILVSAALMGVGLVAVGSASAGLKAPIFGPGFLHTTLGRQGVFVLMGLATLLATAHLFGPRFLNSTVWRRRIMWILFVVCVASLVAALIPGIGVVRNGARRWLHFGPAGLGLGFQPSELAKLVLIVFMAMFLARRGEKLTRFWTGVVPPFLLVALFALLVGVEDFGTAALLAVVGAAMILVAGANLRHLAILALPTSAAFAYMIYLRPYRWERLVGFTNFWDDPQGKGYHAVQSLIGLSSGGWLGLGLGGSIQKHGYLPERTTDFVFSIWYEETGYLGGVAVILLFVALLYLGARAALAARTPFERLLAIGATLMVTLQAMINIAVVTVSVPTKGIALPFVSAGGSGILFLSIAVGLLAGVALRGQYSPSQDGLECAETLGLHPVTITERGS